MSENVSVIGLGKLGAPMTACFAKANKGIIGVDKNPAFVAKMGQGKAPVDEPQLQELLDKVSQYIQTTDNINEAVLNTDITFVIVPTPSDENGAFSLSAAKTVFEQIGLALKEKKTYHLVVMTSTVLPGATEFGLLPILEKFSGKQFGSDFGLCYSPEFIALGSVIQDYLNPDFVLIGESDQKAGNILESFYNDICENNAPVVRMNFANAELTKMSVNSFMTMKISFANLIAQICEGLPGGDADQVTNALSLFGGAKKSLKGGLGYGGPCLPRDNVALAYLCQQIGVKTRLQESVDEFNRGTYEHFAKKISEEIPLEIPILFFGIAYKAGTGVLESSPSLGIAQKLEAMGYEIAYFDPKVPQEDIQRFGLNMRSVSSNDEVTSHYGALFLSGTLSEQEFLEKIFSNPGKIEWIIDPWRNLTTKPNANKKVNIMKFGIGSKKRSETKRLERLAL